MPGSPVPAREHADLQESLRRADQVDADQVSRLVQVAIASAAFGVDTHNLELLLNHLGVEEAKWFRWDAAFLDLFTMSELESLSVEVGLKTALGTRFKAARSGKKDAFIQALLTVEGFAYQGTVPAVMRYVRLTANGPDATGPGDEDLEPVPPDRTVAPAAA